MNKNPQITCIIHTRNEEVNIARAISSVIDFAGTILVVDMNSSDRTVEIASSLGAKILRVPEFGYVEPAREMAVQQVQTEWIFILDADEVATPELKEKLNEIVINDDADAVVMSKRTFMFGQEIKGTGWGKASEKHMLFLKKGCGKFSNIVHEPITAVDEARILDLGIHTNADIIHFNYTNFEQFVEKMNRYTTYEALNPGTEKVGSLLKSVFRELISRYLKHKAWRDGYRGIALVQLMLTYRLLAFGKARLSKEFSDEKEILRRYDEIAAALQNQR